MGAISVVIVDDEPFFLQGLEGELSRMPGVDVLGWAGSLDEAMDIPAVPDVVLLDLGLPGSCRRFAIGDILARWPTTNVLVLTAYASGADVVLAFAEGARGYLAKTVDQAALLAALRAVSSGGTYVTPTLAGHLLGAKLDLTPPERAVLRCVAEGMADKQVAATLGIAPRAVENRLASVRLKAGLLDGSRSAITRLAIDVDTRCQLSHDDHLTEEMARRGRLRRLFGQRASQRPARPGLPGDSRAQGRAGVRPLGRTGRDEPAAIDDDPTAPNELATEEGRG